MCRRANFCYMRADPIRGRKTEQREKRIKALKEHSALSAPGHTTGEAIPAFAFSRAANILTDAAAKAGAAIMRHYHEGPEVTLKDDESP